LTSALKAAESDHVWNRATPTDLLHFFERVEMLLPAIYNIVNEGKKANKVILSKSPNITDVTHYHLYCGIYDNLTPWNFFPRSLNEKEYRNPYRALRRFTSWSSEDDWKLTLHDLLSYALGSNSLFEFDVNLQLVTISEHLHKMLEACHLIYVRRSKFKNYDNVQ
jgi:hypothetical protein